MLHGLEQKPVLALRFVQTLRRLRDLQWTAGDYFWLCELKRPKRSFAERARFRARAGM